MDEPQTRMTGTPDAAIFVSPDGRGADALGIKMFEMIVGIKRPPGKSVPELLDLMPADDKVRVQRAGKVIHTTLVSAINQAFAQARSEAIEECARVAEQCEVTLTGDDFYGNAQIAAAIRALTLPPDMTEAV